MKILIYGLNYWPELTGVGKYTGEMAEWLAAEGYQLRVVTAPPYYPQWKIHPGYSAWKYRSERRAQVFIHRCPLWVPKKLHFLTRLLHLFSFALSSLPVLLWDSLLWRPDIILTIEPTLFGAPAAIMAARLAGARCWLHIQDDEIKAVIELGFLNKTTLHRWMLSAERWLLRGFDRISSISQTMLKQLDKKSVPAEKWFLFPNWVDTKVIYPLPAESPLRQELCLLPGQVVALYAGNMGRKQGLENLLEAARVLRNEASIQFILCGDGSMRPTLMALAEGLPNVRFLPLQPFERLNALLNMADIHLLIQRTQGSSAFMPSKLTGMLASGRPVIATSRANTDVAEWVSKAGMVVPADDIDALVAAVRSLSCDPERRQHLGRQARHIAVTFSDKQTILKKFESELVRVLENR